MIDLEKIVRPNVLKLTPYSCARDEFQGSTGIFMDANENPFGNLNRYPDPYQKNLKTAISKIKGIPAENIFMGNGSDEIIDLTFRVFCNPGADKALIFPPTYGMYEVSASVNDIAVVKVPLAEDFQIDLEKARKSITDKRVKLIFICSPNNPTSNCMSRDDVEWIIKNFMGVVVIDEAYADFSRKQSFNNLVCKYNNLIVMQTFSKAMGMAAARVGFAFMDSEIVKIFNKIKPPYNISTINQEAALKKLNNPEKVNDQVLQILNEREKLATRLGKLKFVKQVYPSDSNFLLIRVEDANSLYDYLVSRNIIIRNRNSIIKNCVRITVGRKSENNELIKALKDFSDAQITTPKSPKGDFGIAGPPGGKG